MIDVGKYFIDSTHSGMNLFLLHFFIPICSLLPTPFSSIPQWSFLLCFGGQETNAILFDAFDFIRSARPTASSDFAVFQCESFDQDVTEGGSKIHVFLGGWSWDGGVGMKGIMYHGKATPLIFGGFTAIWFWGPRAYIRGTRSCGDVKSSQNSWGTN